MTRRRKAAPSKKKAGAGVLTGMRRGVKNVAGTAKAGEGTAVAEAPSRAKAIILNVITGLALLLAAAMILRRCGVIHF